MHALFDPRGVVVAGASSHPGKFGFVALHNILSQGYEGQVYATNREGGTDPRGRRRSRRSTSCPTTPSSTSSSCAHPPQPTSSCSPACAAPRDLGRLHHLRGLRRGRGARAGPPRRAGRAAQSSSACCVAGPNGQGVISTPVEAVRADRRPGPPPGRIGVASQSGNFVSSFQNYAVPDGHRHQPGCQCRQRRDGRRVPDYLEFYADDPETAVGLAYVEGIRDGRAFFDRMRADHAAPAVRRA